MNKAIGVVAAMLAALAGCAAKEEPVQTVEFYSANKDVREAVLKACRDNPGELRGTPNCVNAGASERKQQWSGSGMISPKPIKAPIYSEPAPADEEEKSGN